MRVQILSFLVSSFVVAQAAAGDLPSWIINGPVSDSLFHYVVCSHDGIDPEEARQIAESKCLASAAKLGGVNVRVTQKTVQSLTGSDSSEVAEIQPIEAKIKCEWIDRFLETIKDGFRVWLRCRIPKSAVNVQSVDKSKEKLVLESKKYAEASLVITTIPKADRIIVIGETGERVFENPSNVFTVTIVSSDQRMELTSLGYKKAVISLPQPRIHGQQLSETIVFERN
jgi:hypothetical protein